MNVKLMLNSVLAIIIAMSVNSCGNTGSSTNTENDGKVMYLVGVGDSLGYMDETGKMVVEPQYSDAKSFYEGLAAVKVGDKWGFIDESGKMVIEPQFDRYGYGFNEGLACVGLIKGQLEKPEPESFIISEGKIDTIWNNHIIKYGFIDKTGKIVIDAQFDGDSRFKEGLASVRIGDKKGFIDKTGKMVFEHQNYTFGFSEGLACVWEKVDESNRKYGYINKAGEVVIEPQFDLAQDFTEGLACVRIGDKEGFIDKTGKIVIEPQYKRAFNFVDGLAAVEVDGKYGYINKAGEMVIEPKYDFTREFSEGLAKVEIEGKDGFIDKTGKIVIEAKYDGADDFSGGVAPVWVDKKMGFINKTGEMVVEPRTMSYRTSL